MSFILSISRGEEYLYNWTIPIIECFVNWYALKFINLFQKKHINRYTFNNLK